MDARGLIVDVVDLTAVGTMDAPACCACCASPLSAGVAGIPVVPLEMLLNISQVAPVFVVVSEGGCRWRWVAATPLAVCCCGGLVGELDVTAVVFVDGCTRCCCRADRFVSLCVHALLSLSHLSRPVFLLVDEVDVTVVVRLKCS